MKVYIIITIVKAFELYLSCTPKHLTNNRNTFLFMKMVILIMAI